MKPSKDQIKKLPKWAQRYIENQERERDAAVRALDKFTATQTPSQMWVDDFVSDGGDPRYKGPSTRRCYVQGNRITMEHNGIRLDVIMRDEALDLSWSRAKNMGGDVPMIPRSHNQVWLINAKDLYGWADLLKE